MEKLTAIFASFAPAPDGAPDSEGHITVMLLFYGALFVVIYLFLFRPQLKKSKDTQRMQTGLSKGDSVVTSSGIYGVIYKIKDEVVTLQVAENTRLKVRKSSITERVKESDLKDGE